MLDNLLLAKLAAVESRFDELTGKLSDPEVLARPQTMQKLAKEHSDLRELVDTLRIHRANGQRIDEAREMQKDPEMRDLARQEETELGAEQVTLEERLKLLLLPKDPNDDKNILLEIRGGTGGEEAALFASDLFRMYSRFAERRRWKVEILSMSSASAGGLKEVVAAVEGKGAYAQLKYESGVHRVQRVPATEAQGRVHTSTATVAIMPELEDVDITIDPKD
jgi:peptide chain release factor 1